jgi:hypothetical protein
MTDQELNDRMDNLLGVMNDWYQDEKQHFIETHSSEIERKASELEITCDYYIAEFV